MKKTMKIGLMGCEFQSANKGCEALAYSVMYLLDSFFKTDRGLVIYNLSDTRLGKIQKEFEGVKFVTVKRKIKTPTLNYLRKLHGCDFILDVTMGDSFSDIYSKPYYDYLVKHKLIAEFFCKNYISLPQTYGPFKEKSSAESARKVFEKAKKIYCRDKMSQEILEKDFGIHDSVLVTDMAFLLPFDKKRFSFKTKKTKMGINVSGLLYAGGFHSDNQFDLKLDYKKFVDEMLAALCEDEKVEVHLIPHVVDLSENAHDDDYRVCEELHKKFPSTVLAPAFDNPIDAKSYIANMDFFVGSRMHSTIAAFSSGVPCVPVSYSRKFEGLFSSLKYDYVVNGRTETVDGAVKRILGCIKRRDELVNQQKTSQKIIQEKNKIFISSLKELLIKVK